MLFRGTQERLVSVMMTTLTALLALSPLVFSEGQTGKEILNSMATVIFSGLLSATLLNLIVTPLVFWHYGEVALSAIRRQRKRHI